MKNVLILLLFSLTLFGANVDEFAKEMGYERYYTTARLKAKKTHKPIVMILGSDYCPWCRKFENKTLQSALIKPILDKDFVVLIVDKKYDIKTFPSKYRTQFTPKVFFIDARNENILFETAGYVKRKEFAKSLDKAQNLYRAVQ